MPVRRLLLSIAITGAVAAAVLAGLAVAPRRAAAGSGREHYVAAGGRETGSGSADDPWDLATALSGRADVSPGDTVWLEGGVYSGAFLCELSGTADAPIVVRALPGARATIDGAGFSDPALTVRGSWTVYQDFEVTNSTPSRPAVRDGRPTGVAVFGPNTKFVHLAVHDAGQGFGFWSEAPDSEIYGCLIYNNGTTSYDHGIYVQNATGAKRMVDNVVFHNAGCGIHGYGSSEASLKNLWIEGNALFDNGIVTPGDPSANLLVGGGTPASGLRVLSNATWTRERHDTTAQIGSDAGNVDAIVQGNRFVGYVSVLNWAALSMAGNSFCGSTTLVALETTLSLPSPFFGWDRNRYVSEERQWQPFTLLTPGETRGFWYPDWQAATGADSESAYEKSAPRGTEVLVRASRYEPGRAMIVAYNWDRTGSVSADLTGVLSEGDRFEIRSAQNPWGPAIRSGVYAGGAVSIPMTATAVAVPAGLPAPASAAPEFDVFLLTSSAAAAPTSTPRPPPPAAGTPTPTPTSAGGAPTPAVTRSRPSKFPDP